MSRKHPSAILSSRLGRRAGAGGALLATVAAGALLTAGPASAASRQFVLHNQSNDMLKLETAKPVPTVVCWAGPGRCTDAKYDMKFEGRPDDGSELKPGATHAWDLKWAFAFTGGVQYAANFWYKIAGTDAVAEYTIETYTTSNESACKVTGTSKYSCTAQGLKLTFKNN
ncbi:MAG: hypothetical protein WAL22_03425 [Solirubrobacteraceae bacterium]